VVLARMLALLRSPSSPIQPDDAWLTHLDAHPALAMVRPVATVVRVSHSQSSPILASSLGSRASSASDLRRDDRCGLCDCQVAC